MTGAAQAADPVGITVLAFQAEDGDCLLISCRVPSKTVNILVDGGRGDTVTRLKSFIQSLSPDDRTIDLFVVSHIDSDHIAGAIAIAKDPVMAPLIREIWFNGPQHLCGDYGSQPLSIAEGDELIRHIQNNRWSWNRAFGGKAVMRRTGQASFRPFGDEGPEISLLGPYEEALRKFSPTWPARDPQDEPVYGAGAMTMGEETERLNVSKSAEQRYLRDTSTVNGTSIAFLLRHAGRQVVICADAHAETVVRSIDEDFGGALTVDIATLPHHGSPANMSVELARKLQARHWIISTDGGRNREKKPGRASISRVLTSRRPDGNPIELVFNYEKPATKIWNHVQATADFNYSVRYAEHGFVAVCLSDGSDLTSPAS